MICVAMDRAEPNRVLWIAAEGNGLTSAFMESIPGDAEFEIQHAAGLPESLEYLKRSPIDAAVICLPLSDWAPVEILEQLRSTSEDVPLIFWNPQTQVADAVRLIKLGAFDVLGEEASPAQLAEVIQEAMEGRSRAD